MECYKHVGMNAVAQCQNCGKGLCNECVDRFTLMLCQSCLLENNQQAQRRVIVSFVVSVIFAGLGVYGGGSSASGFWGMLGYAYLGFSLPWGYHFFGAFLANPFRAILALFAGWIIAPFSVYKNVKELKTIQVAKQTIHNNAG